MLWLRMAAANNIKFSVYRNEYAPAILLDCRGVCYYVYEKFSSAGGDKEDPRLA